MKTYIWITVFLTFSSLIPHAPKNKELSLVDCSSNEFKYLPEKPVINLLFDNYKLSKINNDSLELGKFNKIFFEIDFITVKVPRKCYYFEKLELSLLRNNKNIYSKVFNNIDSVDLRKIKAYYKTGDVLMICPFPKLKSEVKVNFCPEARFIKLK